MISVDFRGGGQFQKYMIYRYILEYIGIQKIKEKNGQTYMV